MSQPDLPMLLAFFKALANESRLKLVGLLAQQERSVEELATLLQLKAPTVSHHLAQLKQLNLVQMRPEGNTHLYQLNQAALQNLTKAAFTPNQISTLAEGMNGGAWEDKILQRYLEAGSLREVPASRKKRWVILKWLVNQFEPNQTYPETQLNTILKRFHPDTATLRRELVGYQMMQRQKGYYWRSPESEWRTEPNQQI